MTTQLYCDTHSGAVPCELTGREMTSRQGQRYVEVTGAYPWPMYVPDYSVAADPAAFAGNTIASRPVLP